MCVSYVKRPHTKFDKNQPQSDAQTIMKFQFIRIQPKKEEEEKINVGDIPVRSTRCHINYARLAPELAFSNRKNCCI